MSGQQNLWLGKIEKSSPDLQYAIKNGKKCVGPRKRRVDGYSETTNTAFEFDGCYYHGCSCVVRPGLTVPAEIDAFNKLMTERRKSTEKKKHKYLRNIGNLVVMKECGFHVKPTFFYSIIK